MKSIATFAAAALSAGINLAAAQSPSPGSNPGATSPEPGAATTRPSGPNNMSGSGSFCERKAGTSALNCTFTSMTQCEDAKAAGSTCVAKPATTGVRQ